MGKWGNVNYPLNFYAYINYPRLQAFMDAVDGMRVSLGPMKVLSYVVQVGGNICVEIILI